MNLLFVISFFSFLVRVNLHMLKILVYYIRYTRKPRDHSLYNIQQYCYTAIVVLVLKTAEAVDRTTAIVQKARVCARSSRTLFCLSLTPGERRRRPYRKCDNTPTASFRMLFSRKRSKSDCGSKKSQKHPYE